MAVVQCPICQRVAAPRPENPAFPFCSRRCRMVDLGKWLGEEYRVADRNPAVDEDGVPATPGDGNDEEVH
ncbi:MAG: DNA gyrase inhibitor YacG [Myxococcaceae bacterium]|nr:DNA gyrase inhibitor YacG [Myxococcaceae bacterium]